MLSFMRDFENVEFRRRGPLSAITRSKISRSLRGKRKKGGMARRILTRQLAGAAAGALSSRKGGRLAGATLGAANAYLGGAAAERAGLKGVKADILGGLAAGTATGALVSRAAPRLGQRLRGNNR